MDIQEIIQTIDGWHRNTIIVSRGNSQPLAKIKSTITNTPDFEIKVRNPSEYLKVPVASYDEAVNLLRKLFEHYNYDTMPKEPKPEPDLTNSADLFLLIFK